MATRIETFVAGAQLRGLCTPDRDGVRAGSNFSLWWFPVAILPFTMWRLKATTPRLNTATNCGSLPVSTTTLSQQPWQQSLPTVSTVGWIAAGCTFALGLLSNFTFQVLGTLTLAEPLAAVLLPLLLANKLVQRSVLFPQLDGFRLQLLFGALVASLFGYLLADFYWGSSWLLVTKGVARLVVFLINAIVLWMLLCENKFGWVGFVLGLIVGRVLVTLMYTPLFNDYWKFGFALPSTLACMLVCAFWGRRHLLATTFLLASLVAVNLFFGSRSSALLLFAFMLQRPLAHHKGFVYRLVLIGAVVASATAVITLASLGTRSSTSRSDIQRKTHLQFCLDGIARHPWIGNGTWYEASGLVEHYHELLYRNSGFGRHGGFKIGGDLNISPHCQLLNSWAEGGLLGSSFFICCSILAGRDLAFRSIDPDSPSDQVRDYFLLACLFALAFNPFSGLSRWPLALQLWFILKNGHSVVKNRPAANSASQAAAPRSSTQVPAFPPS